MDKRKIKARLSDLFFDVCKYTLTGSVIVNLVGDKGNYALFIGGLVSLLSLIGSILLIEKGGKQC